MKKLTAIALAILVSSNVYAGTRFEDGVKVDTCQGSTCGGSGGENPQPDNGGNGVGIGIGVGGNARSVSNASMGDMVNRNSVRSNNTNHNSNLNTNVSDNTNNNSLSNSQALVGTVNGTNSNNINGTNKQDQKQSLTNLNDLSNSNAQRQSLNNNNDLSNSNAQNQTQGQDQSQVANGGEASQSQGMTNNIDYSQTHVYDSKETYKRYTPDAVAPPAYSTAPCYVGISAGVGVPGFSGSVGSAIYDKECEVREVVRLGLEGNQETQILANQVLQGKLMSYLKEEMEEEIERAEEKEQVSSTPTNPFFARY